MVKIKRKVTLRQKVAQESPPLTSRGGATSKPTSSPTAGGGRGASGHKRALWLGALGLIVVGGIAYTFWKKANNKEAFPVVNARIEESVKSNLNIPRLLAEKLALSPDEQDVVLATINVDSLVEVHVTTTVINNRGALSEAQLNAIVKKEIAPAIDKAVLGKANLLLVDEPVDAKQMAILIKKDLDVAHLLSSELAITEQKQVDALLETLNLDTLVASYVEEVLKAKEGAFSRGELATTMQKTILPTVRSSLLAQAKVLLGQVTSSETSIASVTPSSSQPETNVESNVPHSSDMPAAKAKDAIDSENPTTSFPPAKDPAMAPNGKTMHSPAQVISVSQREVTCLFAFDSDVLEANELLNSLADRANASRIVVSAYADTTGNAGYNQSLSRRRAEGIRRCLIEGGVSPERIEIHANGETEQFGSNPNNRRAEILLQ